MAKARKLAMQIWQTGVDRVRAERLIAENVTCDDERLIICNTEIDLTHVKRICVVGAGKAAGYLAVACANTLHPITATKQLFGLVNVPENCVVPNDYVELHGARPAAVNEPRPEGVEGTQRILRMVAELAPDDLCICLLTGGGSALLPAPKPPITLDDKLLVTKRLSARGASIQELNYVRIALSDVKGGGLARRCRANRLITMFVSDIIGDPIELIASGPTLAGSQPKTPPRDILAKYANHNEFSPVIWDTISKWTPDAALANSQEHTFHMLGNNQTAIAASRQLAESLGLETTIIAPESSQTTAEEVASQLVNLFSSKIDSPRCILWGGEPVVHLSESAGRGGRNQQLALATLHQWERIHAANRKRLCIVSGGTDGEDGPTDAAGAFVDEEIVQSAYTSKLDAHATLLRNDAYPFFDLVGGLLKTGPTHTNVCDVRVAVIT